MAMSFDCLNWLPKRRKLASPSLANSRPRDDARFEFSEQELASAEFEDSLASFPESLIKLEFGRRNVGLKLT